MTIDFKYRFLSLFSSCLIMGTIGMNSQNPISQTEFTADPAPLVVGDTLYLYTGHDENESRSVMEYMIFILSSPEMTPIFCSLTPGYSEND